MVATLVKRNREIQNVNDDIKKQTNFVKMFFCENDTVISILLQNRVKLISD